MVVARNGYAAVLAPTLNRDSGRGVPGDPRAIRIDAYIEAASVIRDEECEPVGAPDANTLRGPARVPCAVRHQVRDANVIRGLAGRPIDPRDIHASRLIGDKRDR